MSKARSPREVCSTTIGTSGLTVLASFRVWRLDPARRASARSSRRESTNRAWARTWGADPLRRGRGTASGVGCPELPGALGLALLGRPELVAGLRLGDRDRDGRVGQDVDGLVLREVRAEAVEPAAGLHPLEELLRRRLLH